MSIESSPTIIKYTDGVKVFLSTGGVWKRCYEVRSSTYCMFHSTWLSAGMCWIKVRIYLNENIFYLFIFFQQNYLIQSYPFVLHFLFPLGKNNKHFFYIYLHIYLGIA